LLHLVFVFGRRIWVFIRKACNRDYAHLVNSGKCEVREQTDYHLGVGVF
jgi:hypothetical protein